MDPSSVSNPKVSDLPGREQRLVRSGGDRYWVEATLGEAALILGEWAEAESWYTKAAQSGQGRFANLHTTRRQALLLIRHLGGDPARIERCLQIPRVAIFVGHMIDQPDRAVPRFPAQLEPAVRRALRDRLCQLEARLGYASAACGSDIVFLETLLDLGWEAHVMLPYDREQFKKDSVEIIPGANWGERYERVLARATEVQTAAKQQLVAGTVTYDYANMLLHGLGSIRARQLDTELVPLAVWDGKAGDGPGGTAATVQRWQSLGHQVEIVDIAELLQPGGPEPTTITSEPSTPSSPRTMQPPLPFSREIRAMLFADTVGYSKLTEEQFPVFAPYFLNPIAALVAQFEQHLLLKRTAGDGLFLVFSSIAAAGDFALALRDAFRNVERASQIGLPETLGIRIALDAGPVYTYMDPVIQRLEFCGSFVNRAARIEPITPPGHVYASESFATLAAAQGVREFTCDYAGRVPLPKEAGIIPAYHVRRPNDPE